MMGRAHAAVGAAAGSAMAFAVTKAGIGITLAGFGGDAFSSVCIGAAVGAVGGIFPDVDSKGSTINTKLNKLVVPAVVMIVALAVLLKRGTLRIDPTIMNAAVGLSAIMACIVGGHISSHRGFTHSILACFLYAVGSFFLFGPVIGAISLAGYVSHLAIDLPNKKGEQLFFPSKKRLKLGLVEASGIANNVAMFVGSVLTAVIVVMTMR